MKDKDSWDVSGEMQEGKVGYDTGKSKMTINHKITSKFSTPNIAFVNKKDKEGKSSGFSSNKKQKKLVARKSTDEKSSSLCISHFSSDSSFYDEIEREDSEEESSEEAFKSQSDESY